MKDKDLNFEKALADLEAVVDKLEKGGMSLNESLTHFEKGVKLARFLRDELDKAEKKVEILLKDEKGDIKAKPFGLEEEGAGEDAAEEESGSDDDEDESGSAGPKSKGKPGRGAGKKDDDTNLPF
jgi:exodeoxyribonuclease VII small subunit